MLAGAFGGTITARGFQVFLFVVLQATLMRI